MFLINMKRSRKSSKKKFEEQLGISIINDITCELMMYNSFIKHEKFRFYVDTFFNVTNDL